MPDKDIMALIKKHEEERPWTALDAGVCGGDVPHTDCFRDALATLASDWRETADLYDKAKLKGATTTYIVPLRHAAAELDKVIKALNQPRATAAGPRPRTQQCLDQSPHERHPNGVGALTGDELTCIGVPPLRPAAGLDALIADSVAAGRGTLRVEAATQGLVLDETATAIAGEPVFTEPMFPGQATDTEVTDYLKGTASDIPGSPALAPSGVRSLAEVAAEARAKVETIGWRSLAPPEQPQDLRVLAEPNGFTAPELVLDPNGSEHGPDDRNYSLAAPPLSGVVIPPRPRVPETWESPTMTVDGHRPPGVVPPTPLLGQPGDASAGYSHDYVPPGGVPMTYAELMTAVPLAALPPHLSHSQIGTIGECPTKYRAQRLPRQGFEQGDTLTEIPQWWRPGGHAFHAFAEAWERSVIDGHGRTLAADGFTPEDARYEWDVHFGREIELIESTSPVPRSLWRASKAGAEGETWWNANGPLMLSRYVAARKADEFTWSMPSALALSYDLALELERTVDVDTPYGALPYRAVLDRVRVRQGAGEPWITLIIDDYKTSASMPSDTSQLGEYAQVLRLLGVPPQVKILGRFFNARKGVWTPEVDLEREGWTAEWFAYHVASGHAGKLGLTTGPTPVRTSSFCGGCPVRWACPVKGVKVATP